MTREQTTTVVVPSLGQSVEVSYEIHEGEPWPVTVLDPKGAWAWNACVFSGYVIEEIKQAIEGQEDEAGEQADAALAAHKEREAA